MDELLRWYQRLPARNLLVAGVAAFAFVAAFQTFASSGQYQAGPAVDSSPTVWSAPGRYFLDCGPSCQNPKSEPTAVYAPHNYTARYRTINLQPGAYTLKLEYQNVGTVPPNYSYNVRVKVNGKPVSAGSNGEVQLATTGKSPWSAELPVTLPAGETTISLEWLNKTSDGTSGDANFEIRTLSLTSKQASEAVAKRDDQRRNDLNAYRDALSKYIVDNGHYPTQSAAGGITESNEPFTSLKGKYLPNFLADPSAHGAYYFISNGSRYGLCANLESDPGSRYEVGPSGNRQVKGAAKDCQLLN